jgi:RsiW-degrading membrane proteinase PrsW (M82 family)
MAELKITSGGRTYRFAPGQVVRIGRNPDSSVVVEDPTVSRAHARLTATDDGWVFENTGSGATFVAGRPVTRVPVGAATEFRLASPDGPSLLVTVRTAAEPRGPDRPAAAVQAPARPPAPVAAPAPVAGAAAPAETLGAAINILLPVRSWLSNPGWRQGLRLLVIVYGLLPVLFINLWFNTSNLETPGWAYSLYVAPLWAMVFWYLIRPGRITAMVAALAAFVVVGVFALMHIMVLPWEHSVNPGSLPSWIFGVGCPEELAKALPVLAAALYLRYGRDTRLDVRVWLYLGTIAGLTFGVIEASTVYTSGFLADAVLHPGDILADVLQFSERVFIDGFQHAVFAGISGFFIGIGVNYRRRGVLIIAFGIGLAAVLHGLNDWSTTFGSGWPWLGVCALSLLLFVGYTMSAASIEQQVRKTPMFRGDSMLVDIPSGVLRPGGS